MSQEDCTVSQLIEGLKGYPAESIVRLYVEGGPDHGYLVGPVVSISDRLTIMCAVEKNTCD